jgi:uncharacterized glyoxalase superfamily protein PhnB
MAAKRKTAKKAAGKKGAAKKAALAKKPAAKKPAAAKKRATAKRAPAKRAPAKVKGVPAGMHTLTPSLVFKDTASAIVWYEKAFGAKEVSRMMSPDGKGVWHAEIEIGDSIMYANDESPMTASIAPHGPRTSTAGIQIYVSDVDAWFNRAVEAGAHVIMPVGDMFWGDRMGVIADPYGHIWSISTRFKDMTQEEMAAAGAEFARKFAEQGQQAYPEQTPAEA